jgi:hypothetical protein
MSIESTSYHEAGHAVLMLLSEDILGAPRLISALPSDDSAGRVMPGRECGEDFSPEAVRAFGRMLAAGAIAGTLAGFPSGGAVDDMRRLVRLGRDEGRGDGFAKECIDCAEFLLRMHWGGVVEVANILQECGGELVEPYGIELARMALERKPTRQLGLTVEALLRLAPSLEKVPEIADPLKAALAALTSALRPL